MQIIPAIYLQNGQCVSWYKGTDGPQKKTYRISPIEAATQFERQGATTLHLVDLEGSLNGKPVHTSLIQKICKHLEIPVEVGGGVRSLEDIEALFSMDVVRVILGVSAQEIIPEVLSRYGSGKIIFGIKARREWVDTSEASIQEFSKDIHYASEVLYIAQEMVKKGINQIVYKDLEREGTLYHPNYDEMDRLIVGLKESGKELKLFCSGGVVALDDLRILKSIGTSGVIISRALFEHKISLSEAIHYASAPKS